MSAPAGAPRRLRWRPIAAAAAAVLALASITTGFALGVTKAAKQPEKAPVPAAVASVPLDLETPTPAPVTDTDEAEEAASVTVTQLVDATNQILQRADGEIAGIEGIAAGFVRGELEALAAERSREGLKQIGDAKVTSVEVAKSDLESDLATMTLEVCIDVSDIDVVDTSGNSLKALLHNPGHPVLHLYGAEHIDGVWKLTTHEIPVDARCA